ncbi:hypothetical protein R50072_37890 [Simiduia litorea]|uniref:hypothetical protein n=1 Tax=Simiduia litorea TaxID=1435348 RepID=UPI0036F44E2F
MEVKLQIFKNRIVVSHGDEEVSIVSDEPFSTQRLLVGNFDAAWACVSEAEKKLSIKGIFKPKPKVVVEPKELVEGGISQIEDRVFRELSMALNPKSVEILP